MQGPAGPLAPVGRVAPRAGGGHLRLLRAGAARGVAAAAARTALPPLLPLQAARPHAGRVRAPRHGHAAGRSLARRLQQGRLHRLNRLLRLRVSSPSSDQSLKGRVTTARMS